MFCCMRLWESVNARNPSKVVSDFIHHIQLDNAYIGHEVVLVKNGGRICGTGGALATAPLVQSKSYFEVKIQQGGVWSVGLATRKADLNRPRGGQDPESWCLGSDHNVIHNGRQLHSIAELAVADLVTPEATTTGCSNGVADVERLVETAEPLAQTAAIASDPSTTTAAAAAATTGGVPIEGDTLGVAFDHIELNFYLNGKKLDVPVLGVRGTVYPALFVDEGAVLDLITNNFNYAPPPGFDRIMIEQSLL